MTKILVPFLMVCCYARAVATVTRVRLETVEGGGGEAACWLGGGQGFVMCKWGKDVNGMYVFSLRYSHFTSFTNMFCSFCRDCHDLKWPFFFLFMLERSDYF